MALTDSWQRWADDRRVVMETGAAKLFPPVRLDFRVLA